MKHSESRKLKTHEFKNSDSVNKLLVLNHLKNGDATQERIKKIVSEIHSRGLRQRITKKVRAHFISSNS